MSDQAVFQSVSDLFGPLCRAFDNPSAADLAPFSVSFEIASAPEKQPGATVSYDGELTYADGVDKAADIVVTVAWKDLVAIVSGSLSPSVAYMQGRLKSAGNMELWLLLLKASTTSGFADWTKSAVAA